MEESSEVEQCYYETDDEFEDLEDEGRNYDTRKNAIIYLLDSTKEMFAEDNSIPAKNPFLYSLQCIRNCMRARIFASDQALCSVLLLGTEKCNNQLDLKNISVIQPLKYLSADHILNVDKIFKSCEEGSFVNEYGHGSYSLADAFWLSFKIFHEIKNTKSNKSIILFTKEDNPAENDRNEFDRIISSARDMLQNGVLFDLIYLGKNFDMNHLYKELILISRNDMDYVIPNPVTRMEEMVKYVNKTDYSHVSFSKIPFYVTEDFKCDVTIHYLARKAKPPFEVKLSKSTNERIVTKMQWFNAETGEVVSKENLVKSFEYGGKDINFTMNELKMIDKVMEKSIKLVGFKPSSTIGLEDYVKPCALMYPGDLENKGNDIQQIQMMAEMLGALRFEDGTVPTASHCRRIPTIYPCGSLLCCESYSCAFFVTLLNRCLEEKVVPICTFCPRSTSDIRYVALIAQEEEISSDNVQLRPSGFLVFFLPFDEEVRDLDNKCTGKKRATRPQIEAAKNLIKKLRFQYKPELFPNPRLAAHWSAVEALALDLKEPEPVVDMTLPNYELMKQRTEKVAREFKKLVYSDGYDPELEYYKKKSKPKSKSVPNTKDAADEVDVDYIEQIMKSGQVYKATAPMLRRFLQQVGQGKDVWKKKKSELVERVCEYLNIPAP